MRECLIDLGIGWGEGNIEVKDWIFCGILMVMINLNFLGFVFMGV